MKLMQLVLYQFIGWEPVRARPARRL